MVFVQVTVDVESPAVETEVYPTTRGCPSQSVTKDVTLVVPGFSKVSVKPLENVEVVTMAFAHCQLKEELLHVESADAHDDAYSCPVPVVTAGGAVFCVVVVDPFSMPSPDAT
jgi:hypothetical protein